MNANETAYRRQINAIRNAASHRDADDFYQGARLFVADEHDNDFAVHIRDEAFKRLGAPPVATRVEWSRARLA